MKNAKRKAPPSIANSSNAAPTAGTAAGAAEILGKAGRARVTVCP
jgi:hypothetical protein